MMMIPRMMINIQIAVLVAVSLFWGWWGNLTDDERYNAPVAAKAASIGMDVNEFILLSSVVEAESDRTENINGKILIAEVILNRMASEDWPDTITGVVNQDGQFEVVCDGSVCANRTNSSDRAVLIAYDLWSQGLSPNVMYFNNQGYSLGTPYDYVGGNYFVTVP